MPPKDNRIRPLYERFDVKVNKVESGCWIWTGMIDKAGYGRIQKGSKAENDVLYAHRVSYERYKGPVPDGLNLDHLCRIRKCVNPEHLEAVTPRENVQRGISPGILIQRTGKCAAGHDRTPENSYNRKDRPGSVNCLACRRERRAKEKLSNPTEKQWMAQVVQLAHLLGWHTFHTWNSMHSPSGFPDLVIVSKEKRRLIFAELKSENGKVRSVQSEWLTRLAFCNVECYIWRPSQFDEVMKILRRK